MPQAAQHGFEDLAAEPVTTSPPRQGRDRGGAGGARTVSAGERLVTVMVTLVVPEAADPEDAAATMSDAAVSSAQDVVHAVGGSSE